jgi:hypothetical protein
MAASDVAAIFAALANESIDCVDADAELPALVNAAAEERAALDVLFKARSVCVVALVKLFKLRSARVTSVESTLTRMLCSSVAIIFCLYFVTV